jgi:hypothetical protein
MRAAGALAAAALQHAGRLVSPGVTTDALDAAVHDYIIGQGGYPSPLRYGGFRKSVCTSVNECICHGVPDSRWVRRKGMKGLPSLQLAFDPEVVCDGSHSAVPSEQRPSAHCFTPSQTPHKSPRPLRDGDIVNVDVTAFLDGYHGDTNATFYVVSNREFEWVDCVFFPGFGSKSNRCFNSDEPPPARCRPAFHLHPNPPHPTTTPPGRAAAPRPRAGGNNQGGPGGRRRGVRARGAVPGDRGGDTGEKMKF